MAHSQHTKIQASFSVLPLPHAHIFPITGVFSIITSICWVLWASLLLHTLFPCAWLAFLCLNVGQNATHLLRLRSSVVCSVKHLLISSARTNLFFFFSKNKINSLPCPESAPLGTRQWASFLNPRIKHAKYTPMIHLLMNTWVPLSLTTSIWSSVTLWNFAGGQRDGSMTRSSLPVVINKALLEHSHTHSFMCCLKLFSYHTLSTR